MTDTPEYTWGSHWHVHTHYDEPATVIFDDNGQIQIYFGNNIWDLYPCEASSLVSALNEALKAAELCAGKNRIRTGIRQLELHANTKDEAP